MTLVKYRIFDNNNRKYLPGEYYIIGELAEAVDNLRTPYSDLEIHQIEVGKIDLIVEKNED